MGGMGRMGRDVGLQLQVDRRMREGEVRIEGGFDVKRKCLIV